MTAELYHEALVAKARSGSGKGRLEDATVSARLDNPLCGDRVTLDLRLEDGRIMAVGHEVRGCLLCEAAAATIAELALGKTAAEARALAQDMTAMMLGQFHLADIFKLLGLHYPHKDVRTAYQNIKAGSRHSVAHAVEWLDNALSRDLHDVLVPLVDDLTLEEKKARFRKILEDLGDL